MIYTAKIFLSLAFVLAMAVGCFAQTGLPVSGALTADGSLAPNASGAYETSGYSMTFDANGAPRFIPDAAAAGGCPPDRWDTSFTSNGADNQVNVIVADGSGGYYIGGEFDSVQGVPAAGIAHWNGSAWSGLGSGIGGSVYAIAISGTDIYVGGGFGTAGGVPAKNVAKWDGISWSALGAGLGQGTHFVRAVAVFGGDVYFGGNFSISDGSPANGIVKWNGTAYSSVGTLAGQVVALTVSGGALYAGGDIAPSAGSSLGILKWDGTTWTSLGTSANSSVRSITFSGSDMYVTGSRIVLAGQQDSHVAKFDGVSWTRLGFFSDGIVNAVTVIGTDVYVGGYIPFPNNMFNNLAKWNGTSWTGLGAGIQGGTSLSERVMALAGIGNTLVVGGNYTSAGGLGARNIATNVNGTWVPFSGTGIDSSPRAIAVSGTDVYVGGSFVSAGPVTVNGIAKWDGITNTWSALGSGVSGSGSSIFTIAVSGDKVYVGGSFSNIGGVSANNIAVWNGTNWSAMGSGTNSSVTSIVVRGGEVFAGGSFQTAGGISTNRIAKWNGTAWTGFPGSPIPNVVTGMAFAGNDLYVSSDTTTVENPNYLLKFDGSNWTPMAPTLGGHGVRSMAVSGTDIYISGGFSTVNGMPANRVAKWNGTSWSTLGNGLPGFGFTNGVVLTASGPYVYATGDFTTATSGLNRVARWDGSVWSNLGSGIDAPGSLVRAAGGDLFIAGGFTTAGCNVSPYFARWRENLWTGSASTDWHTAANWGGTLPVPNASITIVNADASISAQDVTVGSLIVANGRTLTIGAGRTLTVTGDLDLSSGNITGTGSLVVNGALRLGGNISGLTGIVLHGDLALNGGIISAPSVNMTACRSSALAGGSSTSYIAAPLTRCIGPGAAYQFPVGSSAVYAPVSVSNAVGNGSLTVDTRTGQHPDAPGLPANRLQRWWNITSGSITQANLVFNYIDSEVVGMDAAYRVYRINGAASALASTVNAAANTAIAGNVTSFGAFTLGEAPESIVSISGKVRRPDGRGVRYINVTLSDGNGGVWTTVTKFTGHFEVQGLPAPRQYTITVEPRKSAVFAAPQQQVIVSDNVSNINFTTSTP